MQEKQSSEREDAGSNQRCSVYEIIVVIGVSTADRQAQSTRFQMATNDIISWKGPRIENLKISNNDRTQTVAG